MSSGSGPLFLGPDSLVGPAGWQAYAAQPSPTPSNDKGGQGEDFGKSSPVGLLVLLLFFIAVAFLVRSMTKHLKRVPASFDDPADDPADEPSDKASDEEKPEEEPPAATEEKPADSSAEKK